MQFRQKYYSALKPGAALLGYSLRKDFTGFTSAARID